MNLALWIFAHFSVSPDIEKVHLDDHFDMLNLDLSLLRYDKVIHDLENVLKETTCLCCAAKFQKEVCESISSL